MKWKKDLIEWAIADEQHIKRSRRDEKLTEDLAEWSDMLTTLTHPTRSLYSRPP